MTIPHHVSITVTQHVIVGDHGLLSTGDFRIVGDASIWITLILFVTAAALLVYLANRHGQSHRANRDGRSVMWAMIQPVLSRVKRNEELQETLVDQVKLLSATQSKIVDGLHRQDLESEKLAGYIEAALTTNSKLAHHLAALKGAMSMAKTRPAIRDIQNISRDVVPLDLPAQGILSRLTPTEFEILGLLESEGSLPAPAIGRKVGKSREHTARVLKALFDQGYLERETGRIPFRYRLTEKVRTTMQGRKTKTPATQTDSALRGS